MRLLIYTAAIAVLLAAYGIRIEQMQGEVRQHHAYVVEHQAELGARIEYLERSVAQIQSLPAPVLLTTVDVELQCVHKIYEDGSVVHLDAEIAHECLRRELGWP